MDAGIADTINRHFARIFAAHLDRIDDELGFRSNHWYFAPVAASLMGENDATDSDRAWLVGALTSQCDELDIDSYPADADWEMLFTAIRVEIEIRRECDPKTPPAQAAETQLGCVV